MLGHVGRVAAGGRRAPERLGDAADVMRCGAAAQTEIPDTERIGGGREICELVAIACERVERSRERAALREDVVLGVAQLLERWLLDMCPVRDRQRRDVSAYGRAHTLE